MSFLMFIGVAAIAYFAWRIVDQLPGIVCRLSEIQRDVSDMRRRLEDSESDAGTQDLDAKDADLANQQADQRENADAVRASASLDAITVHACEGAFMNKEQAMARVNADLGYALLDHGNTRFANVNSKKPVWWFHIDPRQFRNDLHLLCAGSPGLIWMTIKANTFPNPESTFRFREDRRRVDLELSCGRDRYLHDVQSGGSGYDFSRHVRREWT